MSAHGAADDFATQVLESRDLELRRMVASGLAPLPLPELLALQVQLTEAEEPEIAQAARQSLSEMRPKIIASVVREGASSEVLRYLGAHNDHPVVVEAILGFREVPRDLLAEMAPTLDPAAQEMLLHRQDAIVEEPTILDALAANVGLSSYSERRIAEYREHLLPREPTSGQKQDGLDVLDFEGDVDEGEVAKLRAEFEAMEDDGEQDDLDNLLRASEVRIRTLPVATRMRLAQGATPLLRRILIRDQNANVALCVLKLSPITEQEVERIALSRIVVDDVLTQIALSKHWIRRYSVVHALCQNPRTPLNTSIRLLPRLSARDLQKLSRSRNVSDAVRGRALRLYRIKIQ